MKCSIPKYSCGTDDITFCSEDCKDKKCYRNFENRIHRTGYFSMSDLKGTELCPSYIEEDKE